MRILPENPSRVHLEMLLRNILKNYTRSLSRDFLRKVSMDHYRNSFKKYLEIPSDFVQKVLQKFLKKLLQTTLHEFYTEIPCMDSVRISYRNFLRNSSRPTPRKFPGTALKTCRNVLPEIAPSIQVNYENFHGFLYYWRPGFSANIQKAILLEISRDSLRKTSIGFVGYVSIHFFRRILKECLQESPYWFFLKIFHDFFHKFQRL